MKISIIIFCYNEEHNLLQVFLHTLEILKVMAAEYEIIIVNDGSTDGTNACCVEIADKYPHVKLITHPSNYGIGRALRSGYSAATKEFVCAIPGDGQFDVKELLQVKPFNEDVYYSFYRPQTNYSFYRQCLTWFNRLFNQHILAVYLRDVNWIKVYRLEQVRIVNVQLQSSLIESEICAKLYKRHVLPIEIPSAYLPRNSGTSKGGNWSTLRKAISETFKLWWVVQTYKVKK